MLHDVGHECDDGGVVVVEGDERVEVGAVAQTWVDRVVVHGVVAVAGGAEHRAARGQRLTSLKNVESDPSAFCCW